MPIPYYCPICGAELTKVQITFPDGSTLWEWQCPEGDWFEPVNATTAEEPVA